MDTSPCDHHLLIYPMLKTAFQKRQSIKLVYKDYTSSLKDSFSTDVSNSAEISQCYEVFEVKKIEGLDKCST